MYKPRTTHLPPDWPTKFNETRCPRCGELLMGDYVMPRCFRCGMRGGHYVRTNR